MHNDIKEEGGVEYMSEFGKFQRSIMEDRNYNTETRFVKHRAGFRIVRSRDTRLDEYLNAVESFEKTSGKRLQWKQLLDSPTSE